MEQLRGSSMFSEYNYEDLNKNLAEILTKRISNIKVLIFELKKEVILKRIYAKFIEIS